MGGCEGARNQHDTPRESRDSHAEPRWRKPFTHDLGPLGNYRTRFDWFYLDYRFWDWLGVGAGRTKVPFGLYNESSDVDAARVPVLLPQSVYPASKDGRHRVQQAPARLRAQ